MSQKLYKIITYIPEEHLSAVKMAMFSAGGGHLGNYECCSWQTLGMGQFRPLTDAKPAYGEVGEMTTVPEWRMEMLVTAERLYDVVAAYKNAHPYEVPAYDVYQVLDI